MKHDSRACLEGLQPAPALHCSATVAEPKTMALASPLLSTLVFASYSVVQCS